MSKSTVLRTGWLAAFLFVFVAFHPAAPAEAQGTGFGGSHFSSWHSFMSDWRVRFDHVFDRLSLATAPASHVARPAVATMSFGSANTNFKQMNTRFNSSIASFSNNFNARFNSNFWEPSGHSSTGRDNSDGASPPPPPPPEANDDPSDTEDNGSFSAERAFVSQAVVTDTEDPDGDGVPGTSVFLDALPEDAPPPPSNDTTDIVEEQTIVETELADTNTTEPEDVSDGSTPASSNGSGVGAPPPLPPPISSNDTESAALAVADAAAGAPQIEHAGDPESAGAVVPPMAPPLPAGSSSSGDVFETGAISFRFDDGWMSQYDNAVPILNQLGFRGTFYISSRQIADNGFAGFMGRSQIESVFADGHEIGAHTRTHAHLNSLSTSEKTDEIAGSRADLQAMGVGPINSFSYPFGEYDQSVIEAVIAAGFTSATNARPGLVTPGSDPFQLPRRGAEQGVSVETMKAWVDEAVENKQWLIITFHRIDTSGDQYATTPTDFAALAEYVASLSVPVVTVTQGISSLSQ